MNINSIDIYTCFHIIKVRGDLENAESAPALSLHTPGHFIHVLQDRGLWMVPDYLDKLLLQYSYKAALRYYLRKHKQVYDSIPDILSYMLVRLNSFSAFSSSMEEDIKELCDKVVSPGNKGIRFPEVPEEYRDFVHTIRDMVNDISCPVLSSMVVALAFSLERHTFTWGRYLIPDFDHLVVFFLLYTRGMRKEIEETYIGAFKHIKGSISGDIFTQPAVLGNAMTMSKMLIDSGVIPLDSETSIAMGNMQQGDPLPEDCEKPRVHAIMRQPLLADLEADADRSAAIVACDMFPTAVFGERHNTPMYELVHKDLKEGKLTPFSAMYCLKAQDIGEEHNVHFDIELLKGDNFIDCVSALYEGETLPVYSFAPILDLFSFHDILNLLKHYIAVNCADSVGFIVNYLSEGRHLENVVAMISSVPVEHMRINQSRWERLLRNAYNTYGLLNVPQSHIVMERYEQLRNKWNECDYHGL